MDPGDLFTPTSPLTQRQIGHASKFARPFHWITSTGSYSMTVTRYTFMSKVPFKTAQTVQELICRCFSSVKELFRSYTLNNGKEFTQHEKISEMLEGKVYFAHPYFSWERGTKENTNGLIRQYFPKDCDFTTITNDDIRQVQDKLNNRPRKVLNMKTPNELLFGISPSVALGY